MIAIANPVGRPRKNTKPAKPVAEQSREINYIIQAGGMSFNKFMLRNNGTWLVNQNNLEEFLQLFPKAKINKKLTTY